MTPIKSNRAPLTKRISALAITVAAALSFAAFTPNAHAQTPKPTKEFVALAASLNELFPGQNLTVSTADADQLAAAVTDAIADQPKYNPGFIAGEALKGAGSNGADAGDEIGTALQIAATDDFKAARDAIKRAGSGKNLNVSLVPEFTTIFASSTEQALALAKAVISSKPGAGAVIGGRAIELSLADQTTLTNSALAKSAKLTAATQDILKYVVLQVVEGGDDTAAFTNSIAGTNVGLASKVGTGGVAGDPTNGGEIVDTLLNNGALPKLKSGIAGFVKSVGKVADIEEIAKIAVAVGNQVGIAAGKTTAIKFGAANGVVKALAKAIVAKATTDATTTNPNSVENKQDEIAEVAAAMVAKILNPTTINGTGGGKPQVTIKNAGAKIFAIVLSAVNATKGKKVASTAPTLYNLTAEDVAGSVAETLGSLRDQADSGLMTDAFFNAIHAFLVKKVNAIGGKNNAQAVGAALNAGYTAGPNALYEDGTLADVLVQVSDYPETDFRDRTP